MDNKHQQPIITVLDGLMRRYKQRVPDVSVILHEMVVQGLINNEADIINDHIAFRTMGVEHLGIKSLSAIFLNYGYEQRDYYEFKTKKLNAYWYSPPKTIPNLPRVFISECKVDEFSTQTQAIIKKYTDTVTTDPVKLLDLNNGQQVDKFLHSPLWQTPTWEDYITTLKESEYAAWVLYNRYYLNHFTITIQKLAKYNTIVQFNTFLESFGIKLNSAGGKIKRSADGKLLQSSSVAKTIQAKFPLANGTKQYHAIAGSYVEFAERIDGRDGFEVGNADKIFESTFNEQIDKGK